MRCGLLTSRGKHMRRECTSKSEAKEKKSLNKSCMHKVKMVVLGTVHWIVLWGTKNGCFYGITAFGTFLGVLFKNLTCRRFSCERDVFSTQVVCEIYVSWDFLGLVLLRYFEPYLAYYGVLQMQDLWVQSFWGMQFSAKTCHLKLPH